MVEAYPIVKVQELSIDFNEIYNKCFDLYQTQKFIDVINEYENLLNSTTYKDHCFIDFNMIVDITIFAALSCFSIGEYQKAKTYLSNFEEIYYVFKRTYFILMQNLRKKTFTTITERDTKALVNYISGALKDFNTNSKLRFYNNLGYAYYKCEEYKDAIKCYKKTLTMLPNNVQLIVGLHQAEYYSNNPHKLNKKFKAKLLEDIVKIQKMNSSYETYLALGKLHYFLGAFSQALNYIHIAISTIHDNKEQEIYAYDWISRIAYKQKQYSTASIFYEKIIKSLVQNTNPVIINHEEIHPKPELYKMLKFLNETQQFIADEENSKLHKSIWAGIFITSIFGIIQCYYENHFNLKICLLLAFGIFILSCIIIRCNIKFFDFLKKHFPTYYNLVRILFKRIL